jgi:hypothetical protein
MFRLTADEWDGLRFQIATSKKSRGGRRYLPYAFTEQGVAMLSSVSRSERAAGERGAFSSVLAVDSRGKRPAMDADLADTARADQSGHLSDGPGEVKPTPMPV